MNSHPDAFMPLWIADYLADTTHLTCEQHGAYLLLLITYWRRGGHLPADNAFLCAVTKLSPQKWRTMRVVMGQFFREEGGQWKNKRADAEILKAAVLKKSKAAAGKKGAEKRWEGHGSAIDLPSENVEKTMAKNGPSPSPSVSKLEPVLQTQTQNQDYSFVVRAEESAPPSTIRPASKPLSSKVNRGTRWAADRVVPPDWMVAAAERRIVHGRPPIDIGLEAEKFVNFWSSKSGAGATKVNWQATFSNWILNSTGGYVNGRSNATGQSGQSSGFLAGIERQLRDIEASELESKH